MPGTNATGDARNHVHVVNDSILLAIEAKIDRPLVMSQGSVTIGQTLDRKQALDLIRRLRQSVRQLPPLAYGERLICISE